MFNQADTDANARDGGLGIGLALVQELALAHGGRVEVESAGIGQGSQFTVWLPLHGTPAPCGRAGRFAGRNRLQQHAGAGRR